MDNTNNTNAGGSVGPVIALIIILAVIVFGGLYFWGQRTTNTQNTVPSTEVAPVDTTAINTQSASDNPSSIQNDLNATDVNSLGSQLNGS